MNPDLSVLFAEVVNQLGIEPMTAICLVVALTTKLLGPQGELVQPTMVYCMINPPILRRFFGKRPPVPW